MTTEEAFVLAGLQDVTEHVAARLMGPDDRAVLGDLLIGVASASPARLAAALVPIVQLALEHLHGDDWPAVVTSSRAVWEDRRSRDR